jgi:guanine nucleotide-binding protein alpha-1 subunit
MFPDGQRPQRTQFERSTQLLLLGQAESGKSTLQKQFQLMYKPSSLEQERASWATVIYFNVVHSLKHILATLEAWDDSLEGTEFDETPSRRRGNSSSDSPAGSSSGAHTPSETLDANGPVQIANLRRRLSPLIATDEQLADRLTGGVSVSGSGKGAVYVRSGWQARTIENAIGKLRRHPNEAEKRSQDGPSHEPQDPLAQEVGRMLQLCEHDIEELWSHPTVKGLIAKRKLKLDEWSE